MSDTYNKLLGLVNSPPKKQPLKEEVKLVQPEKSTNQQNDNYQEKVTKKSESQQNDLSTNQHTDKKSSLVSTKTAKRFTTYLTKESLKAIRGIANDEDRFDYEIFQEAVDSYLKRKKS